MFSQTFLSSLYSATCVRGKKKNGSVSIHMIQPACLAGERVWMENQNRAQEEEEIAERISKKLREEKMLR